MIRIMSIIALGFISSVASAQVFNVPVQPPEMRPGYGAEGKGLHMSVPYGRPGLDCVINPVSMHRYYREVEVETVVETLVAGDIISIPVNVLFDFDKSDLRPQGVAALNEFYNELTEAGVLEIKIVGHTDSKGSDEYNMALGLRRAVAVQAALVDAGFPAEGTTAESAGESQPKVPNTKADGSDDPVGHQTNRRVDVEIVRVADKVVLSTVTSTELQTGPRNPQIFKRLSSGYATACGSEDVPVPAIGVGGVLNRGVLIALPRQ